MTVNPSEQEGNSEKLCQMIYNRTYTTINDWHNPCPLDPNFCPTTNACAIADET